jgi:hypothetical protein
MSRKPILHPVYYYYKAYVYLISNIIQLTSKKINIFQVENSV